MLKDDMKAIAELSLVEGDENLCFGVVEARGTAINSIVSNSRSDLAGYWENRLDQLFAGFPQDSRIAVVLTERSPSLHCGGWAEAARFCDGNISGVLVLEADRMKIHLTDAKTLLDAIPGSFWDAGLPVMFDESGILSSYTRNSEVLPHDGRLSFEDVGELLDDGRLASVGGWAKGMFPVYDISGTDEEILYVKKHSDLLLANAAVTCRSVLRSVGCWEADWEGGRDGDPITLMTFLGLVLDGSTDVSAVTYLATEPDPEEVPYAVWFGHGKPARITRVEECCANMRAVSDLVAGALARHHVSFKPSFPKNLMLSALELHDLMEIFGVTHQFDALKSGVPLDDVLA